MMESLVSIPYDNKSLKLSMVMSVVFDRELLMSGIFGCKLHIFFMNDSI